MSDGLSTFVDDEGRPLYGLCGHCQIRVDNYDANHRITPIMRGGRGVECVLRGDIQPWEARPLWGTPMCIVHPGLVEPCPTCRSYVAAGL